MTFVITTVLVGALIGFGTNLLAIIMLFRPWNEKRLFGIKLPFTPGMVPKRQPEIAAKLGNVVEEHLLTEAGILSALNRPEWTAEMRLRILSGMEAMLADNPTVRDVLQQFTGLTSEEMTKRAEAWTHEIYENRVLPRLNELHIRDLVPGKAQVWIQSQTATLADKLLEMAIEWADSKEVRSHLSSSIQERLMGGGVLGRMAGMFVQEDKLVDELLPYLKNWLKSPATSLILQTKLADLWQSALERNAGQTINMLVSSGTGEPGAAAGLFFHNIGERLLNLNLYEIWGSHQDKVENQVTKWLLKLQQSAPGWVTPLLKSVGISRIVEQEVASFPISKLEKIVLDVVRKELVMITWLGAVLGGLIALIQALLVIGWK